MEHLELKGQDGNVRVFKAVLNSNLRHDIYTQGMIEKCGLSRINKRNDETAEEFAMRIFRQVALGGDVFALLGGLIMPAEADPAKWSEKMAAETAEFLGGVTDADSKARINNVIVSALISFLVQGLVSLTIFQSYSTSQGESASETDAKEAQRIMASGARLSAQSAAAITTERKGFLIGPFVRRCFAKLRR